MLDPETITAGTEFPDAGFEKVLTRTGESAYPALMLPFSRMNSS